MQQYTMAFPGVPASVLIRSFYARGARRLLQTATSRARLCADPATLVPA